MSQATGANAYTIDLIPENKIGGGNHAEVYKILNKYTEELCAAKFLKGRFDFFDYLDKLGYYRERYILKETNHPFVIKYIDDFIY